MVINKSSYTVCVLLCTILSLCTLSANASSNKEVTLSPANYQQVIATELVIVDYWAPWCAPCRKLGAILNDLTEDIDVTIGKLNVDIYPNFATTQHNVQNIPTLIIYKDGKEVRRLTGVFSKQELLQILKPYI